MEDLSSSSSLLSIPMAIVEVSSTPTVKELTKKQIKVKQTESKRKSLTGAQKTEICYLKQKGLS